MPINSIDDIRSTWGGKWADASDEAVIQAYSKAAKLDPFEVANTLGYDPGKGSLTNERLSASKDSYDAGWYGLGEAVAGAVGLKPMQQWMRSGRQDNEFQANIASQRAQELGGIDSYMDVEGVGTGLNWLGGMGAQMVPYAIEAATGGLAARGLSTGLRVATTAGRAAEATPEVMRAGMAAQKSLNNRALAGGVAASYPSSVGDILQNQRDQLRSNGLDDSQTDLLSAGVGGVAYAGLNAVSPSERLLTQGAIGRGVGALDNLNGVKGGLARTGMNAAGAGALEGANELGQEFINQGFGRMAVDPNETFFNEKSNERFTESFVGGAAMGGVMGGAAGGWRRSNGYVAPEIEAGQTGDLLDDKPRQLGLDPSVRSPNEMVNFQDGSSMLRSEYDATMGDKPAFIPTVPPSGPTGFTGPIARPELAQAAVADAQSQQQAQQQQAEQVQAAEAAKQQLLQHTVGLYGEPAQGTTPGGTAPVFNWLGIAHYQPQAAQAAIAKQAEADAKRLQEHQATPGVAEQAEQIFASVYRQTQQQRQQTINDPTDPKAQAQPVKPAIFKAQNFAKLVTGARSLVEVADRVANELAVETEKGGKSPVAAQRIAELELFKARLDAVNGVETTVPVAQAATDVEAKVAPKAEPTTQIGTGKRALTVTKSELQTRVAGAPQAVRNRYLMAMGYEPTTNPDTGGPMLVPGDNPRTFEEVAALESKWTGVKVSKQAVAQSLAARGITEDVINKVAGSVMPNAVSEAELGITQTEDGATVAPGFRVETSAAKAAGAGLVEGDTETLEQKQTRKKADLILKADRTTGTEVGETRQAKAEREAQEAKVNQDIIDRNASAMFDAPFAAEAIEAWDPQDVAFTDLSQRLQGQWVLSYHENLLEQRRLDGDFDFNAALYRDQIEIEGIHNDTANQKIAQVPSTAKGADPQGVPKTDGRPKGTLKLAKAGRVGTDQPGGVGSKTGEVQTPAAQGPDQPGSQAAELSPAVQAKIDEHKAAIADYEKLLACLRGPR